MKLCLPVLAAMLALSGCASIVDGSSESLSVKTTSAASDVAGAQCTLKNNKGTWYVHTPGTVTVHRSYDALNVECAKPDYVTNAIAVSSSTRGMAFGNILFGGVIGAAVDMKTGAAYNYPNPITVPLQPVPTTPAITSPTS